MLECTILETKGMREYLTYLIQRNESSHSSTHSCASRAEQITQIRLGSRHAGGYLKAGVGLRAVRKWKFYAEGGSD